MTRSRKNRVIVLTLHVSVAVILCILFRIWPTQEVGALCAVVTPGLIASLLCFHIWLPRDRNANQQNSGGRASDLETVPVLSDGDKINALVSLADRAHAETLRYREHVWKVVVWTVLLLGATLTAAQQDAMLVKIPFLKSICAVFAVLVTACGLRDVFFDYYWFVGNRNLQRKCERLLKFCTEGTYQKASLLPKRYQTEDYTLWDCVGHLIQWWFFIYATSVYVILAIVWT